MVQGHSRRGVRKHVNAGGVGCTFHCVARGLERRVQLATIAAYCIRCSVMQAAVRLVSVVHIYGRNACFSRVELTLHESIESEIAAKISLAQYEFCKLQYQPSDVVQYAFEFPQSDVGSACVGAGHRR
jgi:hypothetical protein